MKVPITKEQVVCDRPGCGKRVTDKGGAMVIEDHILMAVDTPKTDGSDHIDLCRECLQSLGGWWAKKDESEAAE